MRNIALPMIFVLALSGCISVPKSGVGTADARSWRGKTVVLTDRPRAGFLAQTPAKAMFAVVGTVAAVSAGDSIVKENGIEDPAPRIAREILAAAQQRYGVVPASIAPIKIDSTDPKALAKAAQGADLIIDVQLTMQLLSYFPTGWNHYWVSEGFVLRVIDVHTGALLGGGSCGKSSNKDGDPPTYGQMLDSHAELLKTMLSKQTDACREQLLELLPPAA